MAPAAHSAEVTKKLKAAIKAKLEELGVYVDDELPDYIMVMIANKKEKQQMKNDLNLFLGKTTGKFCDWLFELFERLNSVSGRDSPDSEKKKESASSSHHDKAAKKSQSRRDSREEEREHERAREEEREREKERERERAAREREREREEREKEKERERLREEDRRRAERDREREKERKREREREEREREARSRKPVTHTSRRDEDRRDATRAARHRDRRSRSKTWSDDEFEQELDKKTRKVVSTVVASRPLAASPEPVKVSSQVVVKRKIQPVADQKTAKGRSNMFMKALSEASASAGYGAPEATVRAVAAKASPPIPRKTEAIPPKKIGIATRSPIKSRITAPPGRKIVVEPMEMEDSDEYDPNTVVCSNEVSAGGPKIVVTMKGAKAQQRAYLQENKKRALKRKSDNVDAIVVEKKRHTVKKADQNEQMETEAAPADNPKSPTMTKWDGHIRVSHEDDMSSEEDNDEAEIDAVLASTKGVERSVSMDDDVLPPTHQLSGGANYAIYQPTPIQQQVAPQQVCEYVPTPISQLQSANQGNAYMQTRPDNSMDYTSSGTGKKPERCIFWPTCRQGDSCPFVHPVKPCTAFPSCSYGKRCLYIHPPCRFGTSCKNPQCTYTHGGKVLIPTATVAPTYRAPAATAPTAADSASSTEKIEPDIPVSADPPTSLTAFTPCRFGNKCTKPGCQFKHPKECRFGQGCLNPGCYFYHPPAGMAAIAAKPPAAAFGKYKWKAAEQPAPTSA